MKLIIGGAYQGKMDYVMRKYKITAEKIADGAALNVSEISDFECINNFHLLVKSLLENSKNPIEFTEKILLKNRGVIIILNEIGNGIIPLDRSERIWREEVGRVGCFLAERAESVERIICGAAVKIKEIKA